MASSVNNIHIVGFYDDRVADVAKFTDLLLDGSSTTENKHRGTKRRVPLLDLRRRTSSFLRFKIRRLSNGKKKNPGKDGLCRSMRRYPRNAVKSHDLYDDTVDIHWLDTHVWHKKRGFFTERLWGCMIPARRKNWGMRALRVAHEENAVVQDCSFMRALEIAGSIDDVYSLLQMFMDPSCTAIDDSISDGIHKEVKVLLYAKDQFPSHCIGPAKLFIVPQEQEKPTTKEMKVWLWCHPTYYLSLKEQLSSAAAESELHCIIATISPGLARFSVSGRGALSVLSETLRLPPTTPSQPASLDPSSQSTADAGTKYLRFALNTTNRVSDVLVGNGYRGSTGSTSCIDGGSSSNNCGRNSSSSPHWKDGAVLATTIPDVRTHVRGNHLSSSLLSDEVVRGLSNTTTSTASVVPFPRTVSATVATATAAAAPVCLSSPLWSSEGRTVCEKQFIRDHILNKTKTGGLRGTGDDVKLNYGNVPDFSDGRSAVVRWTTVPTNTAVAEGDDRNHSANDSGTSSSSSSFPILLVRNTLQSILGQESGHWSGLLMSDRLPKGCCSAPVAAAGGGAVAPATDSNAERVDVLRAATSSCSGGNKKKKEKKNKKSCIDDNVETETPEIQDSNSHNLSYNTSSNGSNSYPHNTAKSNGKGKRRNRSRSKLSPASSSKNDHHHNTLLAAAAADQDKPFVRTRARTKHDHAAVNKGGKYDRHLNFDIILPRCWAKSVWLALQHAGARAIGYYDMEALYTDLGVATFPRDSPDTLAGQEYWSRVHAKHAGIDTKRPPRKQLGEERYPVPRFPGLLFAHTLLKSGDALVIDAPFEGDCDGGKNAGPGALDQRDDCFQPESRGCEDSSQPGLGGCAEEEGGGGAAVVVVAREEKYVSAFRLPAHLISNTALARFVTTTTTTAITTLSSPSSSSVVATVAMWNEIWLSEVDLYTQQALPELPFTTLLAVHVFPTGPGVIGSGARILAPTVDDYQAWWHHHKNRTAPVMGSTRGKNKRLGEWPGVRVDVPGAVATGGRDVIGFVTSGREVGSTLGTPSFGFCDAAKLMAMQQRCGRLLLSLCHNQGSDDTTIEGERQERKEVSSSTVLLSERGVLLRLALFQNSSSSPWLRPVLVQVVSEVVG